ncbi:GntR family transcriptional regulator [Streptomyces sp. NPDC012510]|uniref:GntR family transcriptional regulator n=1 Tax=Streptomyces sp. NPDC012510 TaxID=3364838 RepID=UPI0036E917B8
MSRWKAPELPEGPLRELNRALHALHGRAGWPSSRDLQKAVGGQGVVSYTTIHQALTKPVLPRWGVVELLVEELTKLAGARRRPTDTVEHFKELYDRAYGDPRSESTDANETSGPTAQPDRHGGGARLERVTAELRRRITDGGYPLGSLLPPQRLLAGELEVSRDTLGRALRELRDEGWIDLRQGSGSRVIRGVRSHSPTGVEQGRGPVALGPVIVEAFEQRKVTLDVFTLTSESLSAHIRLQAERIYAGQIAPQSITLRVLVPSESLDFPYWRSTDAADDAALKERGLDITRRHLTQLHSTLSDLFTSRLVPSVRFTFHRVSLVPSFKLYLINDVAALHGFYEVVQRPLALNGEMINVTDVLSSGAALTHHVKDDDPDSPGSRFVEHARRWFESVWQRLARPDTH